MDSAYLISPALGLARSDYKANGFENSKIREAYRYSSPLGYLVDKTVEDIHDNGKDSTPGKLARLYCPVLNLFA